MDSGVTLIAPETVWFSHDTKIGRDVIIEPNVFFGPGVTIESGATIHGDGVLASVADGQVVFCQMVPWEFDPAQRGSKNEQIEHASAYPRDGRDSVEPPHKQEKEVSHAT